MLVSGWAVLQPRTAAEWNHLSPTPAPGTRLLPGVPSAVPCWASFSL